MVDYNIVKKCKLCQGRFVVDKSKRRAVFCDKCQKKAEKSRASEE